MKLVCDVVSDGEKSHPKGSLTISRDAIWKSRQVINKDVVGPGLRPLKPITGYAVTVGFLMSVIESLPLIYDNLDNQRPLHQGHQTET